eukprot:m.129372 g.129372  ORF g.129372 m.129372 type:complete len:123 (-) comp22327_c2_seq1:1140-1508(-)
MAHASERLYLSQTTSSIMKDVRVPDPQEDNLDLKLDAAYDHANTFDTDKAGIVIQGSTVDRVSQTAAATLAASQMTDSGSRKVVHTTTVKHFGRECNHGDTHTQLTNGGFARKPNGGGFYSA